MKATLRLDVTASALSAGLGTVEAGVDVAMRRDASGTPVFPGSHIRGKLREGLESLWATAHGDPSVGAATAAAGRVFGMPDTRRDGVGTRSAVRVRSARRVAPTSGGPIDPQRIMTGDEGLAVATTAVGAVSTMTRTAIDPTVGRALDQALVVSEIERPGEKPQAWWSELEIRPTTGFSAREVAALVAAAARFIRHVGKGGSAGWGRVESAELLVDGRRVEHKWDHVLPLLERLSTAAPRARRGTPGNAVHVGAPGATRTLPFIVVLQGPLLIGDGGTVPSVFEGRTDIPGSVVRRAIADVLLDAADLPRGGWIGESVAIALATAGDLGFAAVARSFADISCSFALPGRSGRLAEGVLRPRSGLSFRLAKQVDGRWEDAAPWLMAAAAEPAAQAGDAQGSRSGSTVESRFASALAARFAGSDGTGEPEWIGDHGDEWRGRQSVRRVLATHVAANRWSGAPSEGRLFSARAVAELMANDDEGAHRTWFAGRLRIPVAPDEHSLLDEGVRRAVQRIDSLGKWTDRGYGAVSVQIGPDSDPVDAAARRTAWSEFDSDAGALVPLHLQTEACLLGTDWTGDVYELPSSDGSTRRGVRPAIDLRARYATAVRASLLRVGAPLTLSVTVEHLFADHVLRGGITAAGRACLPPLVATREGAVILARVSGVDPAELDAVLRALCEHGMEVPAVVEAARQRWGAAGCPYTAANGYGEVQVLARENP